MSSYIVLTRTTVEHRSGPGILIAWTVEASDAQRAVERFLSEQRNHLKKFKVLGVSSNDPGGYRFSRVEEPEPQPVLRVVTNSYLRV